MNREDFKKTALDRRKAALEFLHNWRSTARDDYAFVCGNQWLSEDEAVLRAQKRPPITFNYSEKMVDAVVGAEVSNRQEATYRPRGVEDSALAELLNGAAKWAREECGAEDEESDAFRDMLICGLGWTHTRLSYDEDQDGKLIEERIDPLEMLYDQSSTKAGLADRKWASRDWWIDELEAKREWPSAIFTSEDEDNTARGIITRDARYEDHDASEPDRHKGQVLITLYECVERQPIYRVVLGGKIEEISVADFNATRELLEASNAQYVKQYKRVYYRGFFSGETLLDMDRSPCQDGFTFQAMTGKRDRNKGTWYGLTRVMKDPQRWANKWLSQILHIVNSNAKGGLLAEINAFVDPRKAQEEWAEPDSITLLNEGALSGNKVKEKGQAAFPSGLDKLMQFALGSLPMVTGINLEALGLANREQAGVLEAQRKQAAYGLLAPLFDSLRKFRKSQGRVLMFMIQEYLSDGRLIRIGGPESEQFVPLLRAPDALRYDVIVDQSPNAPDVKERTWETLIQLIPAMLKAGMPLPPDLLDFAPLPVALATKWKKFAAEQEKPDPRMQKMQEEMQKLQEENASLKQDATVEMEELKLQTQKTEAELALKQRAQQAELMMKRQALEDEFEMRKIELQQELEIELLKATQQMKIAKEKAENDRELATKKVENEHTVKKMEAAPQAAKDDEAKALIVESIRQLTKTLSSPRKLVTDAKGKPIGSQLVDNL